MDRFEVRHRDVFDSLAAARDAGGADLVLTSPPYPDAREKHEGYASFDTSVEGYHRLGLAVLEALKPGGVCALNIDGPVREWRKGIGTERSLIAFEVALDWAHQVGFRYLEHCAYARASTPGSGHPRWRSGWEPVHVFVRPGAEPHFDRWGFTRPALTAGRVIGGTRNRRGSGWSSSKSVRTQGDRRCITTAEPFHVSKNDSDHPCPFSPDLADSYVLCYSPLDGLVCDPFLGSGTTALSCHRHGRRFIGGDRGHRERDGRRWVDIVTDQLAQSTLFDPVG
jgi:hypothetical protein